MLLEKSWYSLEEAVEKYGVDKGVILAWVEEGLVRGEEVDRKVARVNVDDLELKIQEMTGI